MPEADNVGEVVYVHAPPVQVAVPFWVAAPVIATLIVAMSPDATPQAPPTVVTETFVEYGNVRTVPLTDVRVTTGAVRSTVTVFVPLVPVFAAASDWVAVML